MEIKKLNKSYGNNNLFINYVLQQKIYIKIFFFYKCDNLKIILYLVQFGLSFFLDISTHVI